MLVLKLSEKADNRSEDNAVSLTYDLFGDAGRHKGLSKPGLADEEQRGRSRGERLGVAAAVFKTSKHFIADIACIIIICPELREIVQSDASRSAELLGGILLQKLLEAMTADAFDISCIMAVLTGIIGFKVISVTGKSQQQLGELFLHLEVFGFQSRDLFFYIISPGEHDVHVSGAGLLQLIVKPLDLGMPDLYLKGLIYQNGFGGASPSGKLGLRLIKYFFAVSCHILHLLLGSKFCANLSHSLMS